MKYIIFCLSLIFTLNLAGGVPRKDVIKDLKVYQDILDRNIRDWEKGGGSCEDNGFFYIVGMRNGLEIAIDLLKREKKLHPD